ncbi:MAG: redoxin domain-containing protein [Gemmatimonadetes bacterium]|nr:redoxin domain-containing protein [Gemmatimonadota bacterium]
MNWRRAFLAALSAVPVILLLAWGLTRDPREIVSPLPGRPAPDFALTVFAPGEPPLARPLGDTLALARLRGSVVVLNFWASWCLACRDEHRDLSAAAMAYAGQPVQFVGVLYNDIESAGSDWIREMGGQVYPSVTDPGARTAIAFGLYGVPETFVIDQSGRVAYKHTGPIPEALIRRKVDSLLIANRGAAD